MVIERILIFLLALIGFSAIVGGKEHHQESVWSQYPERFSGTSLHPGR